MRKPDVDATALTDLLTRMLGSGSFHFDRTPDGTSTQVYRVRHEGSTYYARIAEEAEASFAPEAAAHDRIRRAGVSVPDVLALEPYDEGLERAVMLTSEVPGAPIDADTTVADVVAIYRAAGRDLARLNGVDVTGFGFVRREHGPPGWPIRGGTASYADYVAPERAGRLTEIGFGADQARLAEKVLGEMVEQGPTDGVGRLVHGDFDTAHVFAANGRYTGLIDLGEIRGSHDTFDLATMTLEVDPPHARTARDALIDGYAEVTPLGDDLDRRLFLACVLSTTHRLLVWWERGIGPTAGGWFRDRMAERLADLLTTGSIPWLPPRRAGHR